MNSTEAMFLLLKESLFSEEQTLSCSVSDWDWPSIYKELCVHSIESLPYRFLKKNIISDEKLRADWNRRCQQNGIFRDSIEHSPEDGSKCGK